MIINKRKNKKANFLLFSQYGLYLCYIFTGSIGILSLTIIIGLVSLLFCLTDLTNKEKSTVIISDICFLAFFFLVKSHMITMYTILLSCLSFYSTALLLALFRIEKRYFLIMLLLFCLISLYRFIFNNQSDLGVYPVASRNFYTIYFVLFSFPYFLSCGQRGERVSYFPLIICVITSFLSYGRGNIVFSLLLLTCLLIEGFFNKTLDKKKRNLVLFFLCFLALIISYYGVFSIVFQNYFYRFLDTSIEDEERFIILLNYLDNIKLSTHNLLWGIDYRPFVNDYIEHLHNSYLMLHHCLGLFAFLFFLFLIPKGLYRLWKNSYRQVGILCFIFFIKSFTEWAFPAELGDIIVWYLIFVALFGLLNVSNTSNYESSRNSKHPTTIY